MSAIVNVSGLQKPQAAAAIIKRAHQYISTMRDLKKPVDHVALKASDYDAILRSINKDRDQPATGLCIGDVRVVRGPR